VSSDEASRTVDKGDPRKVLPAPDPNTEIPLGDRPAAADPPPATATATKKSIEPETARAERPIPKPGPRPPATILRVASALAALTAAVAFFYPAFRDDFSDRVAPPKTTAAPPVVDHSLSLSVQSHPARATVTVDGVERGHTPALFTVTCDEGAEVAVEVAAPGRETYRTTLPCAQGGARSVAATLQPAR
jgi:hypothetical protein